MSVLIIMCSEAPPGWLTYASSFSSLFALLFLILYFAKPRLIISDDSKYVENLIRIKCENKSRFRQVIKDIKCDVVASANDLFSVTDTLELHKDWITGIRYNDTYIFKVKEVPENFNTKNFIKVRILAINKLGIKKFYEKIFEVKR